ncbi:MAG: bifunctional DNA primase/polymerase, partial [marine benthic group bacterium]|nr:bifunctional DNA primase/polymerase [Gemmatimonadota bacterium]
MTTPTPAEVAQHFIKRLGTPAIPCRGKKPLSKWSKPEGRAATHDQVEPLFNRYRAADSVGLVLGGESGLLVVDTDSEAAAHDHERWRLEHGIPETRTHTSPSGKERRHCWYRAPDG